LRSTTSYSIFSTLSLYFSLTSLNLLSSYSLSSFHSLSFSLSLCAYFSCAPLNLSSLTFNSSMTSIILLTPSFSLLAYSSNSLILALNASF
jgi:hypothetical protein